ncbi:hypothetical protein PENTCL1PPCAC_2251, partial [Pristionchus entomophagus]
HIIEDVNPLSSFRSLSSHIVHFEVYALDDEVDLYYSSGRSSTEENILWSGFISTKRYTIDIFEEMYGAIRKLEVGPVVVASLYSLVCP